MRDVEAIWMGRGCDLARRMDALADELPGEWGQLIRDVLDCAYDPLPPVYPPLGLPPRLRPAVPPQPEPGS